MWMKCWDSKGKITEELKGSQYYYGTMGEGIEVTQKVGGINRIVALLPLLTLILWLGMHRAFTRAILLIGIPQLISPTKTKFVVEPDLVVLIMIAGCTSSKTIWEVSEAREIIHRSWRTNDITQGPHSNAGEVGRQRERKVELEGFL